MNEKATGSMMEPGSTSRLLSVIVATRNERVCAPLLVSQLSQALADVPSEIIFVDDSDDDTPELIERVAAESPLSIRVIHREGDAQRGGLSTAVLDGLKVSGGEYVCIMDADLQHPPELVSQLLSRARESAADIVIASRYIKGGSIAGLGGFTRKAISWGAKWLVKILFPHRLRSISDPLSGFFLARRTLLSETTLRPEGFKILLDTLMRCHWSKAEEIPLQFAARAGGDSKANLSQGRYFIVQVWKLLWDLRIARFVGRSRRSDYREKA